MEFWGFHVTAEHFNTIAVGVGALGVMVAAITGQIIHGLSDRANRRQNARIAKETAEAIALQASATAAVLAKTNQLSITIDGRLSELLETSKLLSESLGVKKGREQVHAEQAATAEAAAGAIRDDKIVDAMVSRIDGAAEHAAHTVPGGDVKRQ